MIDIDGLKIEKNKLGQVKVTFEDGGWIGNDQTVTDILLYEILQLLIDHWVDKFTLPAAYQKEFKAAKRGRAKA